MLKLRITAATTIVLSVFSVLSMTDNCHAQVVPFAASGENAEYSPITAEFAGKGITNLQGLSMGVGFAIPSPTADPLVYDWVGFGSFVAANGDEIQFNGGGQVFLNPLGGTMFTATWVAQFEITGGTGRFANVGPGTAPLDVVAINHPFDFVNDTVWFYDYTITGDIDLGLDK